MAKQKYYVVWKGRKTGVFDNWSDCLAQVDGFTGAWYKSFETRDEAINAFQNPSRSRFKIAPENKSEKIIYKSLSVDAACSGNPGLMEYRGVDTQTKEVLFHQMFDLGTNNIGEFLAIVHGLAELKKRGLDIPVYTDSATALSWIRQKKCKTKLEHNDRTASLFKIVERAEQWLQSNSYSSKILKWDTKSWGEIPADFGRK